MVKIMENPIKMDDLGGKPTIFGFIGRFSSLRNPCLNIDPRLDLARCEGIDELVISCPKAPWDVIFGVKLPPVLRPFLGCHERRVVCVSIGGGDGVLGWNDL